MHKLNNNKKIPFFRFEGVGKEVNNKVHINARKRDMSSEAVVQILLAASCGDRVELQR